ncbi:family 2 encapsulin nanocompartment cargo protein terpene cyclase [Amycolatopsis nigrescens]|uniref:family 2 encapsulin nanocompartment cargo protein terpene cyclase n=1 Tax=Amycolatopsis nigrescens TaxID=381445 RepID=UPI00058EE4BA|nr:family 2 encapsulin nanocompartment cargo protein terpene cyclase [Amycolatopsis nigrescens]
MPAGNGTALAPAFRAGPSGLGTAAARLTRTAGHGPGYVHRPWGNGTFSPLYCPLPERVNDALAEEVDRRLVQWAQDCGFTGEGLDQIAGAGFGRLVMLAHPDTEDPDLLLIAAQLNAAWWAADDYYADDSELGAAPTQLPPRLALVMAAMDPVAPAGEFSGQLDEALRADPILVSLNSGIEHLLRHGTPVQSQRVCYSTFAMFVTWDAYAAWRHTGQYPPAWEYLAARQHDSFYTSMTLVDVVGGYELPAHLYYDPRVRRAMMQAGTASVMVNDLHSVTKDAADEKPVCNMVLQIAADRDCSLEEATEVTVALHNDLVRDFEAGHRELQAVPSPQLQQFMRGLQAWMGGGFEWHATNPRYQS